MLSRRLFHAFQWSVSIALVWYLLTKIDLVKFVDALRNVDVLLLLFSVLQLTLQPLLGAWRWQLIANTLDGRLKFVVALRFVWIGIFFSQALPGTVGGDLVRMWLYYRERASRRLAVNSVTVERMLMVLSLVVVVALVQPGLAARSGSLVPQWLPMLLLLVAALGIGVLIWSTRFLARLGNWLPVRAITSIAQDLRKVLFNPVAFAAIALLSMLAYLNMAIAAWLIAIALDLDVSLRDCIVLIPVVALVATIPLSIGGWGVREGAMMILFGSVGVLPADAVTLSVLFGIAGIVVSFPGVVLWLSAGHRRSELQAAGDIVRDDTANDKPIA